VSIQLVILGTNFFKGAYGAQRGMGGSGSTLAVGQSGSAGIAVGSFDKQDRDNGNLCSNGTGSGDREFDAPHVWKATYEVLPAELGEISLKVDWQHIYAGTRGQAETVAGDTRTITMKEGATHVLDFVDIEPDAKDYCYRNVTVALTAKIAEVPELRYETLEYDLWLRHTDSAGKVHERQFRTIGSQGELVDFRLLPLRFVAAESFYPNGADIESILEISGAVRGRLRADGSIDLYLSASRWIDAEEQGTPRRGGIGDGGTKVFSALPGETVGMILPSPRGSSCVTVESREHCVVSAKFYRDHQDEIILTVNRVR